MKKWLAVASMSFLALTYATTVFAHSHLGASNPADGDIVTEPLQEITLTFDGQIEIGSYIDLQAAAGEPVEVEEIKIGDGSLIGTFTEALPNDDYTVNWSIISADGHPLEGTFSFTVNAPIAEAIEENDVIEAPVAVEEPASEPATNEQAEDTSSLPLGIIIAVAVIIVGAGFFLARRKK